MALSKHDRDLLRDARERERIEASERGVGHMRTADSHRHRPKCERTVGWTTCVSGRSDCGGAHGCVTVLAICRCGATHKTEINGRHVARSEWLKA